MEHLRDYLTGFFGLQGILSPVYILSFVLIGWGVFKWKRIGGGFWAFLLPKDIWSHHSTRTDISLLLIGQSMIFFKLAARFAAVPVIAAWVAQNIPGPVFDQAQISPIVMALLMFVIYDFSLYWIHRAHHSLRTLWPLHAVHHSAAVLTPLTSFRAHPLGSLVTISLNTVIFGTIFGLLIGAVNPQPSVAEIAGANAFVVAINLLVTNFHHSHIWISFGPVVERILISPAQHQVHHSTNPLHFNKNFGQSLAIWDWIFGSLYLIRKDEKVTFGLDSPTDAPLMTQRLGPILLTPLRRMLFPTS